MLIRRIIWGSSWSTGWRSGIASASTARIRGRWSGVGEIDGQPVMLAKPQTFMNLSGTSVAPLMEKHWIGPEDLIVVYDELDLPWMALRIKPKGSAAGHNGVKSVIAQPGDQRFCAGAAGDSSGPSDCGWRGICAGAVQALAKKELDEWSAMRPMRFVP